MRIITLMLLISVSFAPMAFAATPDGKAIYLKSCAMCHKGGIAGSPKLDDKAAWSERLAQGEAVLIEHSIKGYRGDAGYMPPKGGKASLTDDEVSAAVKYMISEVK